MGAFVFARRGTAGAQNADILDLRLRAGVGAVRYGDTQFMVKTELTGNGLLEKAKEVGFFEQGPGFSQSALGRYQLCTGQLPGRTDVGIVQPRQYLALLDRHAFLDQHFADPAGKFR